ncbi:MAG: F0F1 ATP synthase subunit A [Trueperaceae bacterium]|nr:MAG: F0F1 ATP synthase subunit A [Trueperaceae bacterium]
MTITPDTIIYWQWGPIKITATLVFSWLVIAILTLVSYLGTRTLTSGKELSRTQNLLEAIVTFLRMQIREVSQQDPDPYLPFVGTLFLYIALANMLTLVPGYQAPTGSLSTTAALALCVFIAVPVFGIAKRGLRAYLGQYLKPNILMLPFTVIGELSRTLSLAVRLFGNMMSGSVIVAILLAIAPLFIPAIMQAFGLLIGIIQAYIFAILAIVFIASGTGQQRAGPADGARR